MADAFIVSAVRTPVGKAPNGALRYTRPDELAAIAIKEALRARARRSTPSEIEDVILGCAMPEAEQGLNVARIASLRAGVPITASAVTVNRFCSSGLQAIAYAAERIMLGAAARHRRRRHRVDEPGPDGRQQDRAEPGAGRQLPRRLPDDRPRRREPRARLRDLARGAGRVRAAQPPARRRGDRRRPLPRRDVSRCRSATVDVRGRRGAAARHVARGAGEAQAGVPRQGHRDGRQLVADERRRGRGRRHERRARARRSG